MGEYIGQNGIQGEAYLIFLDRGQLGGQLGKLMWGMCWLWPCGRARALLAEAACPWLGRPTPHTSYSSLCHKFQSPSTSTSKIENPPNSACAAPFPPRSSSQVWLPSLGSVSGSQEEKLMAAAGAKLLVEAPPLQASRLPSFFALPALLEFSPKSSLV